MVDSPGPVSLVPPSIEALPRYVNALTRGWSADNVRGRVAADEELAQIALDRAAFIDKLDDPEARGPPVTLPDGSRVPRLPGFRRWVWAATSVEASACGGNQAHQASLPMC